MESKNKSNKSIGESLAPPTGSSQRMEIVIRGKSGSEIKIDITPSQVSFPCVPVPCGDCTICCKLPMMLSPSQGDFVMSYEIDKHVDWGGKNGPSVALFLKRDHIVRGGEDGKPVEERKCVYLNMIKEPGVQGQCSIYPTRPAACRTFDCRQLAKLAMTGQLRNEIIQIFGPAIDHGVELIEMQSSKSVGSIPGKKKRR